MANILQRIGSAIRGKDYSTQWFLDFMRIAAEEDGGGQAIANPFEVVAWVNIAIGRRAKNIARAQWKLYSANGDTEIESGMEWDLFHGQYLSLPQLWEATEGWRCIRGEAFWILGWGGLTGFPTRIVIPDPVFMTDRRDALGNVVAWFFRDSRGTLIPFKPEEVIHFPSWNTRDWIRGPAEMAPMQTVIDTEGLSDKSQKRLLQNNSVPGGVISIPGDFANAEDAQKIIDKWERKHQGSERIGKVAVLSSGATYQRISLTPQELQTVDQRKWTRETILAKWGVPKALVGVADGSPLSGKDTSEQMKVFWQQTLIPELEYFEEKIKAGLFGKYKSSVIGEFDLDDIPELQEDQQLLRTTLRADVAAGILTQNEAREVIGMDPVPWGDVFWKPMALEPVTSGEPPEPAPASPEAPSAPIQDIFSTPAIKAKGRPALYQTAYREMHWKGQIDPWSSIETEYTKKIKDWIFRMRQANIHRIMTTGNWQELRHTVMEELMGDPLWHDRVHELKEFSKPVFAKAVDSVGDNLKTLFSDLGITASFNIWDTRAADLLDYRVNRGSLANISDTIREGVRGELKDAIAGGWTEQETANALKERFNIASNRAPMIARTEIGGVINDSRVEGFKYVGFKEMEWLTAHDERVRDLHRIDGEKAIIGQPFSNGLKYPGDPAGAPENVINCRCLSLPVFEGEAQEAAVIIPEIKKIIESDGLAILAKKVDDLTSLLTQKQDTPLTINNNMPKVDVMLDRSQKVEMALPKPSLRTITYDRDKNGNPLRVFINSEAGKQVMNLEHDENGNLTKATIEPDKTDGEDGE